jgi:hypothetical protein
LLSLLLLRLKVMKRHLRRVGMLTVEMIHATKGRNVMLPKTLNHLMGKISNQKTGFNDVTWGKTTCKYVRLILKAYKKKPENFDEIITCAKEFSKKSCHAKDDAGSVDGNALRRTTTSMRS